MIECEKIPVHASTEYGILHLTGKIDQFVFYCGDHEPFLKITRMSNGSYEWSPLGSFGSRMGVDSSKRLLRWLRNIYPSAERPNAFLRLSDADITVMKMQSEVVSFDD